MLNSLIGDSRAPSEGFFGTIGSAWESGVSKIGSDILPNWVQSQANRQSGDQLAKATFDAGSAPSRQDSIIETAEGAPATGMFQKAFMDIKGGNFGNMPVLILAGALVIGLVIVLKKM